MVVVVVVVNISNMWHNNDELCVIYGHFGVVNRQYNKTG